MTMEGTQVLGAHELDKLRSYVARKHAAMTREQRARIVADAMQRMLLCQLPELEPSLRGRLAGELVRTVVLAQRRPVQASDMYGLCLRRLALDDERQAAALLAWTRARGVGAATLQALRVDADAARKNGRVGDPRLWRAPANERPPEPDRRAADLVTAPELHAAEKTPAAGEGGSAAPDRQGAPRTLRYLASCVIVAGCALLYGGDKAAPLEAPAGEPVRQTVSADAADPIRQANALPPELRYSSFDERALRAYLDERDALLADSPYFEAIVDVSDRYNIHPLLMFAIAGQEQGFVPRSHEQAEAIANNPFNVHYSWQDYNTSIADSTEIAARTVLRWSADRPEGTDPIAWINRKYAEDPNWHVGVSAILQTLLARAAHDVPQQGPAEAAAIAQ
ncbi:glucosaminidase domain-containing protein [Paenibacillus sp. IB182496]|uniref:Glucosaminidase domain-containing protein n=1 Tax=Paenibacillus sabuli TaxID=2772509 RepID=A0A927GUQ0_9BACL|nr:glucosaminidase domain-containing protein [Paenibacillus sabuli]MBD2847937.1 glucosaminidase domain-containing protein [Paenibacillus sabuli]